MMGKLNECIFCLKMMTFKKLWYYLASAPIEKRISYKPVYNREHLKTKINSHGDEVTYLYKKIFPKVDSNHTFLAVITLDTALKKDQNNDENNCFKRL